MRNRKEPPVRKPAETGIQAGRGEGLFLAISRAGNKRLKKLAEIMIPAAKPSKPSKSFRSIPLKKNTTEAPRAVIPQVNNPANKVCTKGWSK